MKMKKSIICASDNNVITGEGAECGAPHTYKVIKEDKVVAEINFQRGLIKENGHNGVINEDLISIVKNRLESFQTTEFSCRENAMAITKLDEALMWLEKRTKDRQARNVDDTYKK